MIIYGIKNCDTVKKFLKEIEAKKINYQFYDYKKTPPTKELLLKWKNKLKDFPVNQKSRTFIQIKEKYLKASDEQKIQLLINNSSAIKRPITEYKQNIIIGYNKDLIKDI